MRSFITIAIRGLIFTSAILLPSSLHADAIADRTSASTDSSASPEKPEQATAEQLARIKASSNVDDLLDMARQYVLTRQLPAAAAAVERIVSLQAHMLTDSTRQSPGSFNEFWFAHRTELRLAKLSAKDVPGRLELAKWLHAAGYPRYARNLLAQALELDGSSAEAKELAEKWHFYGGGPVQFNLALALNRPLFAETLRDENEEITVRKDRTLFILPFAYQVDGSRLSISKTSVKVTTDNGTMCATKGIILLEASLQNNAASSTGLTQAIPDREQNGSEPFWERLQVEPAKVQRDGTQEQAKLICWNTTPPMVVRRPEDRRSRPNIPRQSNKEMPASGFAAFVIEVPLDAQTLDCEYRGIAHTRIDLELLRQMSRSQAEIPREQWNQLVTALTRHADAQDSVVASLAVAKLAMLRSSLQTESGSSAGQSDSLQKQIDKAILKALLHPSQQVCQQALAAIVQSKAEFDKAAFQSVVLKDSEVLGNILDQIGLTLDELARTQNTSGSSSGAEGYNPEEMRKLLGVFPNSPAPWNLFALLWCCMTSGNEKAAERAVDIALDFPSQQTVFILATTPGQPRLTLLKRLQSIPDPEFRSNMLRLLLLTPDPKSSDALLTALEAGPVQIMGAEDPLLLAIGRMDPASLPRMVKLLVQADRSAIIQDPAFAKKIDELLNSPAAAIYQPVLVQWALLEVQQGYQASVKRVSGTEDKPNVFEELLAKTATSDPASALGKVSAQALLASGRAAVLNSAVAAAPENIRKQLIADFMSDRSLWDNEALAFFLACRVSDAEAGIKQQAVASLAKILLAAQSTKTTWRMNLAIKQALDVASLTAMADKSDAASRQALDLIVQLAQLNSSERQQVMEAPAGQRAGQLSSVLGQRSSKLMGVYACMVYLDIAPAEQPKDEQHSSDGNQSEPNLLARLSGRGNVRSPTDREPAAGRGDKSRPGAKVGATTEPEGSKPTVPLVARRNVPLLAVPKLIVEVRDGAIRVNSEAVNFTVKSPASATALHAPDAAEFIKAALASKEVQAIKLAEVIALPKPKECDFTHEQLGTWSSEVSFDNAAAGGRELRPLRITAAKIVLEPMLP